MKFLDIVTLNGERSTDPENDDLTYTWTQVSGTSVFFTKTGAKVTFQAPLTSGPLVFKLVVNDGSLDSDPVTVTVNVAGAVVAKHCIPKSSSAPNAHLNVECATIKTSGK